jgi:hypothetical protein
MSRKGDRASRSLDCASRRVHRRAGKVRLRVTKGPPARREGSTARHGGSTARHATSTARHESSTGAARNVDSASRKVHRASRNFAGASRKVHRASRICLCRAIHSVVKVVLSRPLARHRVLIQPSQVRSASGSMTDNMANPSMPISFTVKKSAPMTAAERQQRCRANGKGRHRGRRGTRAEGKALLAALQAAAIPQSEAAIAPQPKLAPAPAPAPQPRPELNVSSMAA